MPPLEIAGRIAQIVIAAIAVSPFLHKALRLLTTSPQTTDERIEEFEFMSSGRVGRGQRLWYFFLDWCRTEDLEKLSWGEWIARHWLCLRAPDHRDRADRTIVITQIGPS
jgi:hypothetical protein